MNPPIKRNKNIQPLSRDHHATLLFCWKIRQGLKKSADPARIKNYISWFRDYHMNQHFSEEEAILFAGIEDEMVRRAITEHREIESLVNQIVSGNSTAFSQLADRVDDHVRFEERQLFNHLENLLSKEILENIGRELSAHASPVDDYADEFWK